MAPRNEREESQRSERRRVAPATVAALFALSNGYCYFPGCRTPVVVEIRPGVYRKNAQVAHIHGVGSRAQRYDPQLSPKNRDSFSNLLLMCLPHHSEVDDAKSGGTQYPPEVLQEWKTDREGSAGAALSALPFGNEEQLMDLIVAAFESPVLRLEKITDSLERTGQLNGAAVAELRSIIEVVRYTGGLDSGAAASLAFAAEVLGRDDIRRAARELSHAAETLPRVLSQMDATVKRAQNLL
jgi:hypothetical protein